MAGEWDVSKIERGLTAKRFAEWEAYARLEPFDETRSDARAAIVAQVIANVNRGKNTKPFKMEDFMLKFEDPKPKQTWQEQAAILTLFARIHNTTPEAQVPD